MKKRHLLFPLLLFALTAGAAERTPSDMQAIAARYLSKAMGVKAQNGNAVVPVNTRCAFEDKAYAVFTPQTDDAFVIVSKSNLVSPVLGYSQSRFDASHMPDGLRWYLSVVGRNIEQAEVEQKPLQTTSRRVATTPVSPFITTLWHQSDPYNLYTPNNYPAGCVAVAMAQCINYNRYPGRVKFKGYCYYTKTNNTTRLTVDSLDISGIYFYPFLDMYGRATEGQKKSVATLVRDCGYATYMQYSNTGSGTYNYMAGIGLVSCFNYPEECVKIAERRCFTSPDEWNELIYRELQSMSPIIYGGQDEEDGGHAFVLCGLDTNGLVYINWGWGGDSDGYYDIALMNPPGLEFSSDQNMIYGIRTKALSYDRVEPRIYSNDYEPYTFSFNREKDEDGVEHQTIHIRSTAGFFNMTPTTFDGEFGIYGTDLTTGEPWEIKETDPMTWGPGVGYFLNEPADLFYYYVEDRLIPGHTYCLSFGTRDKREGEWHSIIADGGEVAYNVYFTGDSLTTTFSERVLPAAIRQVSASNTLHADGFTRVFDLQGRMLYAVPTERFNLWDVPARGALIVKEGDKVRKVVR